MQEATASEIQLIANPCKILQPKMEFGMPSLLKIILFIFILSLPMACGKSEAEKSKELMASGKFPQAMELLSLLAFVVAGATPDATPAGLHGIWIAKLLHFAHLPLLLMASYCVVRRLAGENRRGGFLHRDQ